MSFKRLSWMLLCMILGAAPAAIAGLVSTEEAAATSQSAQVRERVKELVQRPELAKQLEALGIAPDQAQARVDAMTDTEVLAMEGKLNDLPAGGALNNNELILILIIIILVIAL